MSEISDLEGRITAALDRILRGLDRIEAPVRPAMPAMPPGADQARIAGLEAKLDEERTVNAQLEERVRALKERQDGRVAMLEAQLKSGRARSAALDRDLQGLRQTNAELRDVTAQLRAGLAAGVAEPQLINRAMLAELEALRASRDADIAELEAVMGELKPLIEEQF